MDSIKVERRCIECGIALAARRSEVCLDCLRKRLKRYFKEWPDLKEAFDETLVEMREDWERGRL